MLDVDDEVGSYDVTEMGASQSGVQLKCPTQHSYGDFLGLQHLYGHLSTLFDTLSGV